MGNCFRKITLAILGIDNAGKTCLMKALQGEPLNDIAPTVGFGSVQIKEAKCDVTMYDLGGGPRIRDIWKNYLPEVHGILFVLDGSDTLERHKETKDVFLKLIEHDAIRGKPILLFVNKQDKRGAIDEVDVTEGFHLQSLVNQHKCPCRVETCCATKGTGKHCDPAIKAGFNWLLEWIKKHWEQLDKRVQTDIRLHQKALKHQKEAIAQRVRQRRKEVEESEGQPKGDVANGETELPQILPASNGSVPNGSLLHPHPLPEQDESFVEKYTPPNTVVTVEPGSAHPQTLKTTSLPPINNHATLNGQYNDSRIKSIPLPAVNSTSNAIFERRNSDSTEYSSSANTDNNSAYTRAVEESISSISNFHEPRKPRLRLGKKNKTNPGSDETIHGASNGTTAKSSNRALVPISQGAIGPASPSGITNPSNRTPLEPLKQASIDYEHIDHTIAHAMSTQENHDIAKIHNTSQA